MNAHRRATDGVVSFAGALISPDDDRLSTVQVVGLFAIAVASVTFLLDVVVNGHEANIASYGTGIAALIVAVEGAKFAKKRWGAPDEPLAAPDQAGGP